MAHVLRISDILGWFHPPFHIPQGLDTISTKELRANAHAAWGLFNFVTYVFVYYVCSSLG